MNDAAGCRSEDQASHEVTEPARERAHAPTHEPARSIWHRLFSRLSDGALPGTEAQAEMAPPGRIDPDYEPEPPTARRGAVLMLLHTESRPAGFSASMPLIKRIEDGTIHSGQIALPGGGFEDHDAFPFGTAVRETCEEIGLAPQTITPAGALTPLFIPVSNFSITPVVAVYAGTDDPFPLMIPQPSEVDRIIKSQVVELAGSRQYRVVRSSRGPWSVPTYRTGDHLVWGATAMMLAELFAILRQIGMLQA